MYKKKRIVIVDIKRFILFLTVVMLGINLLVFGFVKPNITNAGEEEQSIEVIVESGDTLWDIAQRYIPEGDTRENVYNIKKRNSLKTAELHTGQTLVIPLNK